MANSILTPFTSVQEKQVNALVKKGMSEVDVVTAVGHPSLSDSGKDNLVVWQYLVDPRIVEKAKANYAGFEVFFKNGKVIDVEFVLSQY